MSKCMSKCMSKYMSKYLMPRHRCWWCKDLFEEGEIKHYRSGWLCDKCKAYLESRGDKEVPDE